MVTDDAIADALADAINKAGAAGELTLHLPAESNFASSVDKEALIEDGGRIDVLAVGEDEKPAARRISDFEYSVIVLIRAAVNLVDGQPEPAAVLELKRVARDVRTLARNTQHAGATWKKAEGAVNAKQLRRGVFSYVLALTYIGEHDYDDE